MDLARKCIIGDLLTGRSPVSIAAAAIYMACNVSNNFDKFISSNICLCLPIAGNFEIKVDLLGTLINMPSEHHLAQTSGKQYKNYLYL